MPGSAGGYRQENEAKIDSSIVTLLGHDDYTIITKILSGKSLIPARAVLGVSNPYVDIRITPPDRRFGDQLQRSSYKPLTVNPTWTPYERFQHTTNIPDSKIVFSLYHLRSTNIRSPPSLGDCVLNLSDVTEEPSTRTLRLYNQATGKELNGELTVMVQKVPSKKALRHVEDIVFEYERWQPVVGWGNKSMLPTDPGSYSNEYGTKFARTFNEVAPPVPRGWTILNEFHCLGNNWEYSIDLTRSDWYTEKGNNCFVRRRPWFREIIDPDYNRISKLLAEPPPAPAPAPTPLSPPPVTPSKEEPKSSDLPPKDLPSQESMTHLCARVHSIHSSSSVEEKTKNSKISKPKPDWVETRSQGKDEEANNISPMHQSTPPEPAAASVSPLELKSEGQDEKRKTEKTEVKTAPTAETKIGCCVVM